jgi:hypothetical protein
VPWSASTRIRLGRTVCRAGAALVARRARAGKLACSAAAPSVQKARLRPTRFSHRRDCPSCTPSETAPPIGVPALARQALLVEPCPVSCRTPNRPGRWSCSSPAPRQAHVVGPEAVCRTGAARDRCARARSRSRSARSTRARRPAGASRGKLPRAACLVRLATRRGRGAHERRQRALEPVEQRSDLGVCARRARTRRAGRRRSDCPSSAMQAACSRASATRRSSSGAKSAKLLAPRAAAQAS